MANAWLTPGEDEHSLFSGVVPAADVFAGESDGFRAPLHLGEGVVVRVGVVGRDSTAGLARNRLQMRLLRGFEERGVVFAVGFEDLSHLGVFSAVMNGRQRNEPASVSRTQGVQASG